MVTIQVCLFEGTCVAIDIVGYRLQIALPSIKHVDLPVTGEEGNARERHSSLLASNVPLRLPTPTPTASLENYEINLLIKLHRNLPEHINEK